MFNSVRSHIVDYGGYFLLAILVGASCATPQAQPILVESPRRIVDDSVSVTGAASLLERVTVGGPSEDWPIVSQDGRWLLLTTYPESSSLSQKAAAQQSVLIKLDLASGQRVVLTPQGSSNREGVWAPDGRSIFFSTNRLSPNDPYTYCLAQTLGTEGESGVRFITQPSLGSAENPDASPDNRTLAFQTAPVGATWQLGLIEVDGRNLRLLGEGTRPRFSPDGNHLLFTRFVAKTESRLFTIDPLSSQNLTEVTSGYRDLAGTWSPDGDRIVFSRLLGDYMHLFVVDATGQNITQLTDGRFSCMSAHWGKDGWIYFASDAGGHKDIWRLRISR